MLNDQTEWDRFLSENETNYGKAYYPKRAECEEYSCVSRDHWAHSLRSGCLGKGMTQKLRFFSYLPQLTELQLGKSNIFTTVGYDVKKRKSRTLSETNTLQERKDSAESSRHSNLVIVHDLRKPPEAKGSKIEMKIAEFFPFLFSFSWSHATCVSVVDGQLLAMLLEALNFMKNTKILQSVIVRTFHKSRRSKEEPTETQLNEITDENTLLPIEPTIENPEETEFKMPVNIIYPKVDVETVQVMTELFEIKEKDANIVEEKKYSKANITFDASEGEQIHKFNCVELKKLKLNRLCKLPDIEIHDPKKKIEILQEDLNIFQTFKTKQNEDKIKLKDTKGKGKEPEKDKPVKDPVETAVTKPGKKAEVAKVPSFTAEEIEYIADEPAFIIHKPTPLIDNKEEVLMRKKSSSLKSKILQKKGSKNSVGSLKSKGNASEALDTEQQNSLFSVSEAISKDKDIVLKESSLLENNVTVGKFEKESVVAFVQEKPDNEEEEDVLSIEDSSEEEIEWGSLNLFHKDLYVTSLYQASSVGKETCANKMRRLKQGRNKLKSTDRHRLKQATENIKDKSTKFKHIKHANEVQRKKKEKARQGKKELPRKDTTKETQSSWEMFYKDKEETELCHAIDRSHERELHQRLIDYIKNTRKEKEYKAMYGTTESAKTKPQKKGNKNVNYSGYLNTQENKNVNLNNKSISALDPENVTSRKLTKTVTFNTSKNSSYVYNKNYSASEGEILVEDSPSTKEHSLYHSKSDGSKISIEEEHEDESVKSEFPLTPTPPVSLSKCETMMKRANEYNCKCFECLINDEFIDPLRRPCEEFLDIYPILPGLTSKKMGEEAKTRSSLNPEQLMIADTKNHFTWLAVTDVAENLLLAMDQFIVRKELLSSSLGFSYSVVTFTRPEFYQQ